MKTEYSIAWDKYFQSSEYYHSEQAMKKAGMKRPYINNILKSAFADGWNAKPSLKLPTDDKLQAMALEKFPHDLKYTETFLGNLGIDNNLVRRVAYLQALRDLAKVMGGQDE